jgi:formate hydrogenlyase subunit 6/NADH:ubiquinone oxidoreductase subunit I
MCLYCWWVCPNEAITLTGQLNHLTRQVQRYKSIVETI